MDRDRILLTPGPLTTTLRTKLAMLRDWGSWDTDFIAVTARVRAALLDIIHGTDSSFRPSTLSVHSTRAADPKSVASSPLDTTTACTSGVRPSRCTRAVRRGSSGSAPGLPAGPRQVP